MGIKYKIDILEELKAAGFSSYRLRKEQLLGEATIQQLREGGPISLKALDVICGLLDCQPGDVLGRVV